jgi:hypothetical protein
VHKIETEKTMTVISLTIKVIYLGAGNEKHAKDQ